MLFPCAIGRDHMCTTKQCRVLDATYRKYRKEKLVEEEDIWAVNQLCETGLLKVSFHGGRVFAYAKSRRCL